MGDSARAHIIVKGMVQGVFYRSTTAEKALSLGLKGWVRNLANGDVEAVAEGKKEDIEKLVRWCRQGPPAASVSSVNVTWKDPEGGFNSFGVTY